MPVTMRRVVIATDFSTRSLHAARWAALHFAADAEIVLVHVTTLPELPRFLRLGLGQLENVTQSAVIGATQRLKDFAATLHTTAGVATEVRVGGVAEQIVDVARDVRADLIIVGRHGDRPGVMHRIGTTADRVVRISHLPVLLATSMRDARPRHLLAALDDAEITPTVVEWARFLAERFDASLTGLHVVPSATLNYVTMHACIEGASIQISPGETKAEVERNGVAWVRSTLGGPEPTKLSGAEIAFGWTSHEIIASAERHHSELIVIGRTGAGLGRRLLLGSVSRRVLHAALCPVLVVVESAATPSAPEGP